MRCRICEKFFHTSPRPKDRLCGNCIWLCEKSMRTWKGYCPESIMEGNKHAKKLKLFHKKLLFSAKCKNTILILNESKPMVATMQGLSSLTSIPRKNTMEPSSIRR